MDEPKNATSPDERGTLGGGDSGAARLRTPREAKGYTAADNLKSTPEPPKTLGSEAARKGPAKTGELWTRFRAAHYRARRTLFVPASTCSTLAELTGRIRSAGFTGPTRLYLVGPSPFGVGLGGVRSWVAGDMAEGVTIGERGHYFDGAAPTLRFQCAGADIDVMLASQWYGDGAYTVADCSTVWAVLADRIEQRWPGATMLATPSALGRDLLARSLGEREFPVMSAEIQELIRSTSGQGRIEVMPGSGRRSTWVEYDGRMMYAACVRELGHGFPVRDHLNEWPRYTRGRALVDVRVPDEWRHVGLLPVKADDGARWEYPAEPGRRFSTWADGAEIHLAQQNGWELTIRERLIFPEQNGRPLDSWAAGLLAVEHGRHELTAVQRAMMRAAVRAVLLHTIGALHGRSHRVSRTGPAVPTGAREVSLNPVTGLYQWVEHAGQAWPAMAHPEWSAAVWARARARLLDGPAPARGQRTGMLHLPAGDIVGCWTDAVYMTSDPRWADDGKVGRLRHVRTARGDWDWPGGVADLLRLKTEVESLNSAGEVPTDEP